MITPAPADGQLAPAPMSGHHTELVLGDQRATLTDVGAKIVSYEVDGRPVVTAPDPDIPAPVAHGAVLAPWPNRVRDGRYTHDGTTYQLDLSEPPRSNAIHGLVMWHRWTVQPPSDRAHEDGSAVTYALRLPATPGYPHDLALRATYRLVASGLHVQVQATNLGRTTAPYGIGFHPWLSPGGADLDECTLQVDAATHVVVDDRLLPVGEEPVSGRYDLRTPRSAAGLDLDDAFLDVLRDDEGLSWVRLTGADGRTAAVWMDESMDTWQVCTGDALDQVPLRRTGVAAEPMSCIADAFNTGDRLVRLAPGDSHEVTWGAVLL